MREIKFRAWNPVHKSMHYPKSFDWVFPILLPDRRNAGEGSTSASLSKMITTILMQYTGLKDKNDKEIYEGDILTCNLVVCIGEWDNDLEYVGERESGVGVYLKTPKGIVCNIKHYLLGKLEVTGNIYKNPELQ